MKRLCALLADSSYKIVGDAEKYFQNVFYLIFKLLGFYVEVERNTSDGRMDAVVKTDRFIYVFEFKLDKPAQEALDQINSTIDILLKRPNKKVKKLNARIVLSKVSVPRISASKENKLKQLLHKSYGGGDYKKQSRVLEDTI
jgi:hypothetical protein